MWLLYLLYVLHQINRCIIQIRIIPFYQNNIDICGVLYFSVIIYRCRMGQLRLYSVTEKDAPPFIGSSSRLPSRTYRGCASCRCSVGTASPSYVTATFFSPRLAKDNIETRFRKREASQCIKYLTQMLLNTS